LRNLALTISYDGTSFAGFQRQPNQRTVQGVLEEALSRLEATQSNNTPTVTGSGRTDAGVHALAQVVNFVSVKDLPDSAYLRGLNSLLPRDLVVKDVVEVPLDFNARKSAKAKEYHYWLKVTPPLSPLGPSALEVRGSDEVDLKAMNGALKHFLGTHDFAGFRSSGSSIVNTVRTIYDAGSFAVGSYVVFAFLADGFLYNMVRIIMGTLLDVGMRKIPVVRIPEIIKSCDRLSAGKTIGPEGLYLYRVYYGDVLGLYSIKKETEPKCHLDIHDYFT